MAETKEQSQDSPIPVERKKSSNREPANVFTEFQSFYNIDNNVSKAVIKALVKTTSSSPGNPHFMIPSSRQDPSNQASHWMCFQLKEFPFVSPFRFWFEENRNDDQGTHGAS